jgi:long-chain acyl-CoA synthetase
MSERFADLVDLFEQSCARYADRRLFGERREGKWIWTTYAEVHELVARARAGLAQLGVAPGDRVAVVAKNRVEWAIAAYATYSLGATFVPMYPAQSARDWVFVLRDSSAKVLFVAADLFDRVHDLRNELPSLEHVVVFDREGPEGFAALLARGARTNVPVHRSRARDVAGFVYTSGVSAFPKAVMQSHGNVVANVNALREAFEMAPGELALSFLPWSNAYGLTCELHALLAMGACIAINDGFARLFANLAELSPTVLVAAPRLLELVYEGMTSGADFDARALFGGKLRYLFCASAMLDRKIAETLERAGLPLYEGYGLSEVGPSTINTPTARRLGSVGRPLPGVRVEIDAPPGAVGEIVVHGANVMLGYHERPQETAKAFTRNGGLRTGDLGRLDAEGFLWIEGRIEDAFVLSTGRVVMPERLEERLALSPYIDRVTLWGAQRPHVVALVVLDVEAVRTWAAKRGLGTPVLTSDPAVRKLVAEEIARLSAPFDDAERPVAFALTTERFTLENGLLTPTSKVRRAGALARHRTTIEMLFREEERPSRVA